MSRQAGLVVGMLLLAQAAAAQFTQQGSKLVGTGAVGAANQGYSVAISADGNTAILGGNHDSSNAGAAWVFSTLSFAVWVPVASRNAGLNQSQWRSDLGLLNTGSVTANVQLSFYGSGGVVTNTVYVPTGAQSILTDVVGQLGGSGSGAIGIFSDQLLKVTARSYNQVSSSASCYAGGTQGQDYPAVATSDGLAAGQSASNSASTWTSFRVLGQFSMKTDVFTKGQKMYIFSVENSFVIREAHVKHRESIPRR